MEKNSGVVQLLPPAGRSRIALSAYPAHPRKLHTCGFATRGMLFSWYVSSVANYSETYGTVAAIVILLMWFLVSAYA